MVDSINPVAPIARIIDGQTVWSTMVKTYPNGRMTTQQNWTTPQHLFTLEYEAITLAEWQALRDHFNSAKGMFLPFPFTDPHENVTYTVRYADDTLSRTNLLPNMRGRYMFQVKLEEVK